jgi:hypothetical protein
MQLSLQTRVPIKLTTTTVCKCTVPCIVCIAIVTLGPTDMSTRWNSQSFFWIIIAFVRALHEATE